MDPDVKMLKISGIETARRPWHGSLHAAWATMTTTPRMGSAGDDIDYQNVFEQKTKIFKTMQLSQCAITAWACAERRACRARGDPRLIQHVLLGGPVARGIFCHSDAFFFRVFSS